VFSDDVLQLAVPESWYERPDFGRTASLRVASGARIYLLVIRTFRTSTTDALEEFTKRVTMQLAKISPTPGCPGHASSPSMAGRRWNTSSPRT